MQKQAPRCRAPRAAALPFPGTVLPSEMSMQRWAAGQHVRPRDTALGKQGLGPRLDRPGYRASWPSVAKSEGAGSQGSSSGSGFTGKKRDTKGERRAGEAKPPGSAARSASLRPSGAPRADASGAARVLAGGAAAGQSGAGVREGAGLASSGSASPPFLHTHEYKEPYDLRVSFFHFFFPSFILCAFSDFFFF